MPPVHLYSFPFSISELDSHPSVRDNWNQFFGYEKLLEKLISYAGIDPWNRARVRLAEIGGTVAARFFTAIGAEGRYADGGYDRECRILRPAELVTLANVREIFGNKLYDLTCSRMVFDSPGIDAISDVSWKDPWSQKSAAEMELLCMLATLTKLGGYSCHLKCTHMGWRSFAEHGYLDQYLPAETLARVGFDIVEWENDVCKPTVLQRVLPKPFPPEPLTVGRKQFQYITDRKCPKGYWALK